MRSAFECGGLGVFLGGNGGDLGDLRIDFGS